MRIRLTLVWLVAALLLAACATPTPNLQPTVAPDATGVGTSPGTEPTPASVPTTAPTSAGPVRPTFTVQRGEIIDELQLSARLAQVQQGVAFGEDGIVKELFVRIGDEVEAGQLLAELDNRELDNQLAQAQTILEQDERAVSQAAARSQIAVRQAQVDLDAARTNLDRVRQPARPDELLRARGAVQQAEADLQQVRNDTSRVKNQALTEMTAAVQRLTATQELYGAAQLEFEQTPNLTTRDRFISLSEQLRQAEADVNRTRIDYDTALSNELALIKRAEGTLTTVRADLEALLARPDPFDVANAQQNVRRAQIALDAAVQSQAENTELAKLAARSRADVERLNRQIESRRLLAPMAGRVISIEAIPGMAVRAANPIMLIANPDNRELLAELPLGADGVRVGARLLPGQPVQITFSRYPDQVIPGVVSRAPDRNATGVSPSTEYAISFDAGRLSLEVGDQAQVTAILNVIDNALWLPPQAIRITRDRAFVIIDNNGEDLRVEIQTGIITEERIEILGGVKEGDVILGEVLPTR
ncbi:MAG: biotin/lipoyl-binding protein [Oscillochloridaceae bacterium umkhey_bin13]